MNKAKLFICEEKQYSLANITLLLFQFCKEKEENYSSKSNGLLLCSLDETNLFFYWSTEEQIKVSKLNS